MSYTRYLVVSTLIIAAVVISAAAPRGMSLIEVTALMNTQSTTSGELDTFLSLAARSSVGLESMGRDTLLVPNDAAFDAYFERTSTDPSSLDQNTIDRLVEAHLIRGKRDAAGLEQPKTIRTRAGTSLSVEDGVLSNGERSARIIRADANAANGIVHVINGVLVD